MAFLNPNDSQEKQMGGTRIGTADVTPPSLPRDSYEADRSISQEEQDEVTKKIDRRLIPTVFIMYLFSYLDRSNIGNAYTVSCLSMLIRYLARFLTLHRTSFDREAWARSST